MATAGRNDPCPCGSGKKYKKCCLAADSQKRAAERTTAPGGSGPTFAIIETALDTLSNSVIDLIQAGDFGAAEAICRRLLREYPDHVDGIHRLAMVHEARGERIEAAKCYREAAEFMRRDPGFDPEGIAEMIEAARRLEGEE